METSLHADRVEPSAPSILPNGITFTGILFPASGAPSLSTDPPDCFPDLNLDLIVEGITRGKAEYRLEPFFWTPLRDPWLIQYRQDVMRDLENEALLAEIKTFSETMISVRRSLALGEKLDYEYHRKGWVLEAALLYVEGMEKLARVLHAAPTRSEGLRSFGAWIIRYVGSEGFKILASQSRGLKERLSSLRYCVHIEGGKVKVKRYEGEEDYSVEIEKTFEKFRQGTTDSYLIQYPERGGMNHVEGKILGIVAKLFPQVFAELDVFVSEQGMFLDQTIVTFEREVQFYVAYLDFIQELKRTGYPFCYPEVRNTRKEISLRDGFDLALAYALSKQGKSTVTNDFRLDGPERVWVVTGPNQGGKTTFGRMVGQLHYLASLGCPIPGREGKLFLADRILTHFERKEELTTLRGKLEDDLIRVRQILARATPHSLFILNEIFSSTTLRDALFLSKKILHRILELDALCVWVTFLDELASFHEKTVSMVATVDPSDPTQRTFRVVRKPADGMAHALSLARKYRLTYEQIRERIP